jgi:hypothetical protein
MGKITAREYYRRAAQCLRISAAVHDIGQKALILNMGRALVALAEQGRQETDDQTSFKQSVHALPSTHKRRQIIRSETSTRTNRGHNGTIGAAPTR